LEEIQGSRVTPIQQQLWYLFGSASAVLRLWIDTSLDEHTDIPYVRSFTQYAMFVKFLEKRISSSAFAEAKALSRHPRHAGLLHFIASFLNRKLPSHTVGAASADGCALLPCILPHQ
jgi:hypothetical protein